MKKSDKELLADLVEAYFSARRNKRNTQSQLLFESNLEHNIMKLYDELRTRTYKPSNCICFITDEPVKREVFASDFRDRVVHHLLYDYVNPIFERLLIYDSYSCRKGKGTMMALERYEHHIRSCSRNYRRPCYILQLDLSGYFMSIPRARLRQMIANDLERMRHRKCSGNKRWDDVVDFDFVSYLIDCILSRDPTIGVVKVGNKQKWEGLPRNKSLFCAPKGIGLPIGDLTSQLFSNVFLNRFDQFCKRELRCRHYGRYVDDFYIMDESREWLKSIVGRIRQWLKEMLGLRLNDNKTHITFMTKGTQFMGGYIMPYRRMLRKRTIWKFHTAMDALHDRFSEPMELPPSDVAKALSSINSYCGLLRHYDTYRLRQRVLFRQPMYRYFNFASHFRKCYMKRNTMA